MIGLTRLIHQAAGRKFHVAIRYKSGTIQYVWCKKLSVSKDGSSMTSLEWEDMVPKPLHMGIDEIESIWQLE